MQSSTMAPARRLPGPGRLSREDGTGLGSTMNHRGHTGGMTIGAGNPLSTNLLSNTAAGAAGDCRTGVLGLQSALWRLALRGTSSWSVSDGEHTRFRLTPCTIPDSLSTLDPCLAVYRGSFSCVYFQDTVLSRISWPRYHTTHQYVLDALPSSW
jgi:hypothetical protein